MGQARIENNLLLFIYLSLLCVTASLHIHTVTQITVQRAERCGAHLKQKPKQFIKQSHDIVLVVMLYADVSCSMISLLRLRGL